MLGAIIGDISGSRFEWDNIKVKEFELLPKDECFPTDDSVMTVAIANAILKCEGDFAALSDEAVAQMRWFGQRDLSAGYGGRFFEWLLNPMPRPYSSYGNGAAMRVSPCAYAAKTLEEAKDLSMKVTAVTHNHPEGLKGAEATTVAIWMALHGKKMQEIRDVINETYYPMNFTLDEIRPNYEFNETCQGTVPQALTAFFESTGFEDAIRNAISIGGDSDTLAAITGSVAEAYYGIPTDLRNQAFDFLDDTLSKTVRSFETKYGIPPLRA